MSMLSYVLLGRLELRHDYFADGWARAMRFVPAASSQPWLREHGLLLRSDGARLAVHAEQQRLPELWQALRRAVQRDGRPVGLDFELRCEDPDFALYSGLAEPPPMRLPLLDDAGTDLAPWLQTLGRSIELRIPARRTLWRYLLLGDWADHRLQLHDPAGRASFSAEPDETLGDGRSARVFQSTEPLALSEAAQPRLQLRDAASQPPRVLMSRLPGAAPRGLQRQMLQGRSVAVSEIFVSR